MKLYGFCNFYKKMSLYSFTEKNYFNEKLHIFAVNEIAPMSTIFSDNLRLFFWVWLQNILCNVQGIDKKNLCVCLENSDRYFYTIYFIFPINKTRNHFCMKNINFQIKFWNLFNIFTTKRKKLSYNNCNLKFISFY